MIKQTIHFEATPSDIFDSLMDEKKHSDFTGAHAKIENRNGGRFSVWDGYATGKNLQLIPGKKIVQSWKASDWPAEANSTVTIELQSDGHGTKLIITHENVPDEFEKDIEQGWKDYYWEPLKKYLKKI